MRNEIRIAGFGGQGVITIGILLARAAGEHAGMRVAQTQSYGPEARGGACKSDVVLSDALIDYLKILDLNHMLVMSQPALNKYGDALPDGAFLLVDSTLVTEVPPRFSQVRQIAATALAEEMGLRVAANVIMFGALASLTGWVPEEACRAALAEHLPPSVREKNIAAFDKGYSMF